MQPLQRTRGRELLTRYGAQALSIEWDLVQRGLIFVYWTWIVALSLHLTTTNPLPR